MNLNIFTLVYVSICWVTCVDMDEVSPVVMKLAIVHIGGVALGVCLLHRGCEEPRSYMHLAGHLDAYQCGKSAQ